ncbi:MAG: hypothetical protein QMD22_11575, partial [archaeon]|nr:hypothetical protein [archaeon]
MYKKLYESALGKFDIYILFLERGTNWLTEGGKIGYIISNQFMVTDYGEKIRKIIVDRTKIIQLVDFGDSGVFADVTNYPAILISEAIRDRRNIKNHIIKVAKAYRPKEDLLSEIKSKFTEHFYYTKQFKLFEYPQLKLNEKTWNLLIPQEKNVFGNYSANPSHANKVKDSKG